MATKKDFYSVLGVGKSASKDEIKTAYRKLAKQYHPDVNKAADAEQKFKEVQEAYDILYDDQKRAAYDQFGHAAFDQNAGGNPFQGGGFGNGFSGFQDVDLGDIFGSFFGGGQRRSRQPSGPQRGADTQMRLRIDFMDAINGKKLSIPIQYDESCVTCAGSGARSSSDLETCRQCGGTGRQRVRQRTILGMMETETVCDNCQGKGKKIKHVCNTCQGKGYNRVKTDIEVNIPAGINAGQQIRIPGKGERGDLGGPNGDLYLEIAINKHPHFTREGNDIHIEIPISFVDATLGITLDIPTVYGDVSLIIPAGTQPEKVLKIKGKGVKDLRGQAPGDQYIHLKIETPTKLSKKQRELLESFRAEDEDDTTFKKFKKFFRN
ncbi:MAG: molecular chaperone DnaJ [Bacilli bacterium]